jgi:hypothetical protein
MASSTINNPALQTHIFDVKDRGLRFTNDEWNGSIANGQPIMLRWNESIEAGEMRLFRISYSVDGVISVEPRASWTGLWYKNELFRGDSLLMIACTYRADRWDGTSVDPKVCMWTIYTSCASLKGMSAHFGQCHHPGKRKKRCLRSYPSPF